MTNTDSDLPVNTLSMARVLIHPSLDSPGAVKVTRDQRRLCSACADAQADLTLRWSHKSYHNHNYIMIQRLAKRPSLSSPSEVITKLDKTEKKKKKKKKKKNTSRKVPNRIEQNKSAALATKKDKE